MKRMRQTLTCAALFLNFANTAFADDVQKALELLTASVRCPIPAYEPTYEPGEPVPNASYKLHDEYKYDGDKKLFRLKLKTTILTTGTARDASTGTSLTDYQTQFSELGAVISSSKPNSDDYSITLACKNGRDCLRVITELPNGREISSEVETIKIKACDAATVAQIKLAIVTLINATGP